METKQKKKKNPFKGDQTETDQEQQTLMTQDIKPVSDMTESNKTTKHEEKPETNKKLKEDEKQDFQQEKQTDVKVVNPKSPQEHESPRRTNTGTIETLTQTRAKDSPGGGHSAGTEQKPQASVAMSSQAQPADGCTRADRPLSPETQDPRAHHTPTGARQSQGVQARSSSCQLEKNQHAAEEKLKEEHHHLQKKHAEISNMKKEPETSKHKTHPNSKNKSFQEQNKSSSANHSSVRGDIILDKVDKLGQYICLKNTSSENKLMGDWEVKLQVNETQPVTYRVEKNFTLKAGERLTLHRVGAMSPYPDDAEMGWMGMTDWEFGDDLKISLISNTGEEHRLK